MSTHTSPAKEAQGYRQENECVQGSPNDERKPDSEVVDFKYLAAGKCKDEHSKKLGNGDTAEDTGADIDQCCPCASIFAAESRRAFEERG